MNTLRKKIELLTKDATLGDLASAMLIINDDLMKHTTRHIANEKRIADLEKKVATLMARK